jgi:hypothetical protein
MSAMSPYWLYLVQALLIVHVLKTGRSRYWILILLFLPLVGGLAYLVVELLPDLSASITGQRAHRRLRHVMNPGGRIRRLAAAWEQTPNADNARHYAEALLETGHHEEAEAVLDRGLSGLFSTEPNLMLLKARVRFATGDARATVELLEALQEANPEFRSAEGHLLLARALESSGQLQRALQEYQAVAGYYPGVEARYRHAVALQAADRPDEARAELEQIIQDARLAPGHFRKAQATWLRRVREALKQ